MLTIEVLDNDYGGHKDLFFSIEGLTGDRIFDTYYFAHALEDEDPDEDVRIGVKLLLEFWKDKIIESESGEVIYLPIDFSDQYTGCLRVRKQDSQLTLTYGYSLRKGWVNPLLPDDYYKSIDDFEPDSERELMVNQEYFIELLNTQIRKL